MYQGESYQVTAVVQNTGVSNWVRNKPYEYYAFSYRWYNPGTGQTISGNEVEIPHTVGKGTTATVTLTINDVPNWEAGTYRLKLDMIRLTRATLLQQYTEAWFGDGGWYVYDIQIEGVSLVGNYRTQFRNILSKESPAQLIERIASKVEANEE